MENEVMGIFCPAAYMYSLSTLKGIERFATSSNT